MPALVMRGVDMAVLGKMLQQQKREGRAEAELIEAAALPTKGAPEPGKGTVVDVVA
ncbi:MAG TPA: hypothetical protein VFZ65_21615 [Planctomycetota bacterium]|nr:hypothetical protein [Planctomycetota bacterium]